MRSARKAPHSHASGTPGNHTISTVLDDQATIRGNPEAPGGQPEDVRRGFALLDIVAGMDMPAEIFPKAEPKDLAMKFCPRA